MSKIPSKQYRYSLDDVVNFGMHSGSTLRQIIDWDKGWVEWAQENVDGFYIDSKAQVYLDAAEYPYNINTSDFY